MRVFLTDYRTAYTETTEFLDDVVYPQRVHWFPESYSKVSTGMVYPPHKVADKVLCPELLESLRSNRAGKTAFILASGNAHFAGVNPRKIRETRLSYTYRFLPLTLTQIYAGRIAQSCGASDYVATDASACASSLKVMMDVRNLIQNMGFDRVIVLAVEDQVCNSNLEFFGETRAALMGDDGAKPGAFDPVNSGFHVGQGAALAVFESEYTARSWKAELLGAYTASEPCDNPIGQREDGKGFAKAIRGAIKASGVDPSGISIVKTHGTGTESNNRAEAAALVTTLKDFVATSYKPRIGHTMGASGLLETCLLLDDMKRGTVPGIANRTQHDDVFLSHDIPVPEGLILSMAAGMGNIYSAAIFDGGCRGR